MSKIAAYTPEDQTLIKQVMPLLLEIQVARGFIAENDEALKAALAPGLAMTLRLVDTLNAGLEKLHGYDAGGLARIKTLTLKFVIGKAEACTAAITEAHLLDWLTEALRDASQISNAVDEYLCG